MSAPRRVQLSRREGWRMPDNTVKVDRSSRFGNCYVIGEPGVPDAATAVEKFRCLVLGDDELRGDIVKHLHGKNLACWCAPEQPCHADVLLEIANTEERP